MDFLFYVLVALLFSFISSGNIIFILDLLIILAHADVLFNFSSDLAIEVGQSAGYHCSVNDTRVSISWFINGSSNIPSDIIVTGTATSSNLTIPGLTQYNNTEVRCATFGYLDNNVPYNNFSESILRLQGTRDYNLCRHYIPYQVNLLQLVTYHVNRTDSVLSVVGFLHSH